MQPEAKQIPDWARKEREQVRTCIRGNISLFWETAVQGARLIGRGAIMVDVAARGEPIQLLQSGRDVAVSQ